MMTILTIITIVVVMAALLAIGIRRFRHRGLDRWLFGYLATPDRRRPLEPGSDIHLLLCLCDHFEPMHDAGSAEVGDARVARWVEDYPRRFDRFRDADGRPPRHTFFYPMEQYNPAHVDALAGLCRLGFGEVEVHLHHDGDTSEGVRRSLTEFREILADRHGMLARRRSDGANLYGFIHGNWCLDNSRPDGRYCGVNDEINALIETGCYADFTMPSAPDPTQTLTINSLYYAIDDPARPKSHDRGVPVGVGPVPDQSLMMIQGPVVLSWRRPKWGVLPRIENACIQSNQAATIDRLDDWLRARVQVPSRPDWYFVKLHTHGGPESNQRVLLDAPMVRFHEGLANRMRDDPSFHVHYVTARELYNLARAAEAGWTGSVAGAIDYELTWNGAATHVFDHSQPRPSEA